MTNHPNRKRSKKCAENANFHEGDLVTIYNSTISGRPFIEGVAIIEGASEVEDQYKVRFRGSAGESHYRFVYPGECQEDPEAYITKAVAEFEASGHKVFVDN